VWPWGRFGCVPSRSLWKRSGLILLHLCISPMWFAFTSTRLSSPPCRSHCIPVLLSLLITTLHAAAGRWLVRHVRPPTAIFSPPSVRPSPLQLGRASIASANGLVYRPALDSHRDMAASRGPPAAAASPVSEGSYPEALWEEPRWFAPAAGLLGSAAASVGWAAAPSLGLLLVVLDPAPGRPCGALALGYLLLLPLLLLAPPKPLEGGGAVLAPNGGSVGGAMRWLLPALAGLYCLVELLVQYGYTVAVMLIPDVATQVRYWVG
jgi:hypothetical protein